MKPPLHQQISKMTDQQILMMAVASILKNLPSNTRSQHIIADELASRVGGVFTEAK